MRKTTKKKIAKTKVLSRKRGLNLYHTVRADVLAGDTIREACAKHNFPVYKYTYWKKQTDESNALDDAIDKHELFSEVLHDSSQAAIKDRLARIDELKDEANQAGTDRHALANKVTALGLENHKLLARIRELEVLIVNQMLDKK